MTHPFGEFLTGQKEDHPFGQFLQGDDPDLLQLTTPLGRRNLLSGDDNKDLVKLQALRAKANPEQQKELDKMIERINKVKGRGPVTDLAAGVLQGMVGGIPAGIAFVAGGAKKLGIPGAAKTQRLASQDAAQAAEWIPTKGKAGTVGNFLGSLETAGPYYSKVANKVSSLVLKAGKGFAPELTAKLIEKMGSKNIATRAAAHAGLNTISGLPISAIAALDGANYSKDEAKKQAYINLAADAIFGAIGGVAAGAGKSPHAPKTVTQEEALASMAGVKPAQRTPDVEALINEVKSRNEATSAQTAQKKARQEFLRQQRELAKANWQIANPEKKWGSLSKEDRLGIVKTHLESVAGQAPQTAPVEGNASPASAPPGKAPIQREIPTDTKPDFYTDVVSNNPEMVKKPEETWADWDRRYKHFLDLSNNRENPQPFPPTPPTGQPVIPEVQKIVHPEASKWWDTKTPIERFDQIELPMGERRKKFDELDPTVQSQIVERYEKSQKPKSTALTTWQDVLRGREMGMNLKATNQTLNIDELRAGISGIQRSHDPIYVKNFIKRLGAMRRFVAEGGELEGVGNAELKKLVDEQIERVRRLSSYEVGRDKDFDALLNQTDYKSHEDLELDRAERERIAENERTVQHALAHSDEFTTRFENSIANIMDRTGETREQIIERLTPKAIEDAKRQLDYYKKNNNENRILEYEARLKKLTGDTSEEYPTESDLASQDTELLQGKVREYNHYLSDPNLDSSTARAIDAELRKIEAELDRRGILPEYEGGESTAPYEIVDKQDDINNIRDRLYSHIENVGEDMRNAGMDGSNLPNFSAFYRALSNDISTTKDVERLKKILAMLDQTKGMDDIQKIQQHIIDFYNGPEGLGNTGTNSEQVRSGFDKMRDRLINPKMLPPLGTKGIELLSKIDYLGYDTWQQAWDAIVHDPNWYNHWYAGELSESEIKYLDAIAGRKPGQGDGLNYAKGFERPDPGSHVVWWDNASDADTKKILKLIGVHPDEWTYYSNKNYYDLPSQFRERISNLYLDTFGKGPKGGPQQPDIIESTKTPAEVWNDMPREVKIAHLTNRYNVDPEEAAFIADSHWDDVDPETQSVLLRDFGTVFNSATSPQVVVPGGGNRYELSAQEYADRQRIPDDMRTDFIDAFIDAHSKHPSDPDAIVEEMLNFGAANELSEQQIMQGLHDVVGFEAGAVGSVPTGEPSLGGQEVPISPISEPAGPSPLNDPYAALTPQELDDLKELYHRRLERDPNDQEALQVLDRLAQLTPPQPIIPVAPDDIPVYGGNEIVKTPGQKPSDLNIRPVEEFNKLFNTSLRKLTDQELEVLSQELDRRIQNSTVDEARIYKEKLNRLSEEKAKRQPPQGPTQANMPPFVAGFALGSTYGYVTADEDSDKMTNAIMWGLAGAAATHYAYKGWEHFQESRKPVKPPLAAWEQKAADQIESGVEGKKPRVGLLAQMRMAYQQTIRMSEGIEQYMRSLGLTNAPAWYNAGKLAEMRGNWLSTAETWIRGTPQTVMETPMGPQIVPAVDPRTGVPIKSIREIVDMVGGDTDVLDRVMVAFASNELRSKGKKAPFDQLTSDMVISNAPNNVILAAQEMRSYHAALVEEYVKSGLLSTDARDRILQAFSYAPLKKMFSKAKVIPTGQQPISGLGYQIQRLKGSQLAVQSPYETTLEMTAKMHNAAEINRIKSQLVDAAQTNPEIAKSFIRRVGKDVETPQVKQRAQQLMASVGLTQADAIQMAASFEPQYSVEKNSGTFPIVIDGIKRTYRVNEPLAVSLRAMSQVEQSGLMEFLGIVPQIARRGVTMSPQFFIWQSVRDTWQATLNSRYGFRWGVDSFLGWSNIVRRTPAYREMIASGGGNPLLQSRDVASLKGAVGQVHIGRGSNVLVDATHNLKEYGIAKAWETLVVPFAEAARMGEYLRARGHGADVIESVYAAKHITGNFQMRGAALSMQALNRMTMFLNPALQAIDQAAYRAGVHPFRGAPELPGTGLTDGAARSEAAANYLTKAFATLVLPSYWLWMANKDDAEINDLRKTASGSRYWFIRTPWNGEIIKIAKPQGDGQIFATSIEDAMDDWYGQDPTAGHRFVEAAWNDMAPNLLPQLGVLIGGLGTNTNLGLGGHIVPEATQGVEPEFQARFGSSDAMREVSHGLNPLTRHLPPDGILGALRRSTTPAGLDYIVNNIGGILGTDAVSLIGMAAAYKEKGMLPVKEELPVLKGFMARYPTLNVGTAREFYRYAQQVDEVAQTINHLKDTDIERLAPYIEENMNKNILIQQFMGARQTVNNLLRAADDLKEYDNSASRRATQDEIIRQVIEYMKTANQTARAVLQEDLK